MEGTDQFLVHLQVKEGNKIKIEIDADGGLAVKDCVAVSRHVEHSLDRETEDFELQVTSPGLDQAFRVPRQYMKNVGRQVKVRTKEGQELTGKLISANETSIEVETKTKEKVEGKKGRQTIVRQHQFPLEQVKETKVVISFK